MSRKLELLLASALILSSAASLALQRFAFVDPTDSSDWEDASAYVLANLGEGDVVRVEPWWYERALTHLTDVGDQVDRTRDPWIEDLYAVDRVFIMAQADRLHRALDSLPFAHEPPTSQIFGTTSVAIVDVPDDLVSWELLRELDEVDVTRVGPDGAEQCDRWNERLRRWDCGRQARWLYVGEALREVGDDPRKTIWAHPLDGGRTLRLEATVPPAMTLRVRGSFDLRAARLPRTGEVTMQVFVNDRLVHHRLVTHDDHSYAPVDVDLSGHETPVRLRIEIDLRGSIKDRYFFVNAWTFP